MVREFLCKNQIIIKRLNFDFSTIFFSLLPTLSIRMIAECVALSCQVTRKLKRATTLEFTNISAIIFIHC